MRKGRDWRYLVIIIVLLLLAVLYVLPGMLRNFREAQRVGAEIKQRQGR